MSFSPPRESNLSKPAVDKLAARLATKLGYRPGAALEPIVSSLGGKIVISAGADLSEDSSGSIRIRSENDFEIVLARHTGPARDRFTIAHELGHYVLHYLWPKHQGRDPGPIEAQRYGSGRVEWEANWFAAGFLMPGDLFRASFAENEGDIDALAAEFDVSAEAVRVRISTLELA